MSSFIASVITILVLPYILSGIVVNGLGSAIAAACVLGIVNALIRPVLQLFSLPLTLLTFGLFTFVVNGAMIMLTSFFVPGFVVLGWWDAILGAILISLINSVFFNRKKR